MAQGGFPIFFLITAVFHRFVDGLPYSQADMNTNSYGNFGYPYSNGYVGGAYSGRPGGGAQLPYGYSPYPGTQNVYPQQAPFNGGFGGNIPGSQFYPGTSNGFVTQQGPLLQPGFNGGGTPFSGAPSFATNNFIPTQPDLGNGAAQFAPSFVSNSPVDSSNFIQTQQPNFAGMGSQFQGAPSNAFVQSPQPVFNSQFAGGQPSVISNSPPFLQQQQQPVSQFVSPQQPADDPLGIVPDIQPNSGFTGAFGRQPISSSGTFTAGSGLNFAHGGSSFRPQQAGFSSPTFTGSSIPQTSSGSTGDIFASVLQSMGV